MKPENLHSLERTERMMARWMSEVFPKDRKRTVDLCSFLEVWRMCMVRRGILNWFERKSVDGLAFKCQTGLAPSYLTSSCMYVDRRGQCQPQISKHEHHAPSTNKNKNDRAARIFLLLPSCMELQSPQCSQILGAFAVSFQEKPENVSFSKLILL